MQNLYLTLIFILNLIFGFNFMPGLLTPLSHPNAKRILNHTDKADMRP